ncbi:AAA family ATPase [Sulfitobacter sp. OXR-159]|jgi:cell division protease FtsH|uniref:AAA family ATPase n=1 Tax=Sulfitobacter sp. OXR-159 TaxID=3100174 RepID=UPI002AC8DAE7|nr:AAA family ATPase [Sulfitobacter sp. OXR-159]WPZ29179.1 AAA family ATPase [Sulfitobacter sp. OXR-159]
MPNTTHTRPDWTNFAHRAITNLRRHNGVPAPHGSDTEQKMEPVSELDELFARFDDGDENEAQAESSALPSRYVPARQLLTAIRLAATFGGSNAFEESRHCGALTVISDIAPSDLNAVKDVLKLSFPHADWTLVAPDIMDGKIAKNAQDRFEVAIAERIDRIEPVLILQANGVSLPRHLVATGLQTLPFAAISRDILMTYMLAGHLCVQIPDPDALLATLPKDVDLAHLVTLDICAALRAPTPMQAVQRLDAMIRTDAKLSGPRLEDFEGEAPALTAARRIVEDLLSWKDGKTGWHEISRSLLLYGPPGTGKTYLARAMANSAGITFINASFADWQAKGHLGEMLGAMKHSFAEARQFAPSVLIIDEIDAVGSRSDGDRHASNYRTQVINAFLGEMDAIAKDEGVVVIGTCNRPGRMDPAVIRAGRMDIKIHVPLPDAAAILGILRHHLRKDIADGELQALSHLAVGQSAADIDAAIRAARSDARHARKMLNVQMIHQQMGIETSGADDRILWRIALHEAGHTVAGAALGLGEIESITITNESGEVQRRNMPHESLLSDIEAEIIYSLAGRAAEKLVLGEVSAGAGGQEASDLALATRAAIHLETTLGLGHEGLVWHARPEAVYLQTPAIRDRVRQRLTRAEQRAGVLLAKHRDVLEALARDLVKRRSLRAGDIRHWLREITRTTTATADRCASQDACSERSNLE